MELYDLDGGSAMAPLDPAPTELPKAPMPELERTCHQRMAAAYEGKVQTTKH